MTYKHIVVNLGNPATSRRPRVAATFAKRHGAYLQGVYYAVERRQPGPGAAHAPTTGEAAHALGAERQAERAREGRALRDGFDHALGEAGASGEFVAGQAGTRPLWECLLDDARCADLTIIGKPNSDAEERKLPQHLVAESGGPVMVLPETTERCPGEGTVAIAWNGSREVARAVRDAMPVLEGAGKVVVFMARPGTGVEVSARRLQTMLEHHGVRCELHREPGDLRPADLLLSRCEDHGADLLVMGAYGRARLREVLSGGATTGRILQHTTLPLLMSQ